MRVASILATTLLAASLGWGCTAMLVNSGGAGGTTAPAAGTGTADTELARRVRTRLAAAPGFEGSRITVVSRDGRVTLAGSVPSASLRRDAGSVALSVRGVISVSNQLAVAE